jgi:general stress protein 26
MNREEVLNQIKDFQHVFLATMDGDQPRVRPVTLISFGDKYWIMTDKGSEKVKQVQNNPKVEISFIFRKNNLDCCLRITGLAEIVKDQIIKKKLAEHCDFFSLHWESAEDPNYALLQIIPHEALYVTPEKTTHIEL